MTFHRLGISSFQVTNSIIFQRGRLNHQPGMILMKKRVLNMNPGGDFIVFFGVPWAYWDFRIVPQSALWLEPMEISGWRRCQVK